MRVAGHVARDVQALPNVMQLAERFFSSTRGDAKCRYAVELALEEVFTNMVRHNSKGTGQIAIALDARPGEVVITIEDPDAPGFNPFNAPPVDVSAPLSQRTPGGLGIHLVTKMMDGIEYSHSDRTSTITLRKRMN